MDGNFGKDRERSSDVLDTGTQLAEEERATREREVRDAARPETHPNFDGKHCVEEDCGEEIPEERLKLGRVRCVDCQGRREKERAVYGKH